jgi:hypothetical protein
VSRARGWGRCARRRGLGVFAWLALGACLPASAHANGAFPASGQVLVDPGAPDRIAVKTTYGLVTSEDAGASWQWTCEPAMFVPGGDYHPQLAISAEGTIYGGLLDGMVRGRIGACAWSRVASLEGASVRDVSQGSDRAIAVLVPEGGGPAEVWESFDDAASWSRVGAPLPEGFVPFTLDAAPTDPAVLYVSGMLPKEPPVGGLLRSIDGGATWESAQLPHSDAAHAPYVAAVDPLDAEVVWVRLDGAPGELLRSTNGGFTFTPVLRAEGFLRAFALSPDGAEVLAGGEVDGLLHAGVDDLDTWSPLAEVAARCVRWREETIEVCGTETIDGFTVARSTDGGQTFEALYAQRCLSGPLDCESGTPVAACAETWPLQSEILGVEACGAAAATSSTASAPSGSVPASATGTGAQGSGVGGSSASADGSAEGGGCLAAGATPRGKNGTLAWLAVGLWIMAMRRSRRGSARRRRRRRDRTPRGGPPRSSAPAG